MCSFLIFNWLIQNIDYVNFFLKFRGPDTTNVINFNNYTFIHNLLHLTGEPTLQPFVDEENKIIAIFNGEIYNYLDFGNYKSDGCCIIDLYKKHGFNFIEKLDGEFALALFDFSKDVFCISTDVFATKPLWYSIDNGKLGISTYESGLTRANLNNAIKVLPNTSLIFSISKLEIIEEKRVFIFDFTQKKINFEDWEVAFINSINKRTKDNKYPIFVCLSSGYDSGAICCALNQVNKKYITYTIIANENISTLNKRITINSANSMEGSNIIEFTKNEFDQFNDYIHKYGEVFKYNPTSATNAIYSIDDHASVGMAKICSVASKHNQRIYLSGSGADEICSDYGYKGKKIFNHSCFGGMWPDDLNTIISNDPKKDVIWKSFYHGTQRDYLAKEEIISGLYGIEGRYPYLDKYVVQEFLWLTRDLKYNIYKSPIDQFMSKYDYPFDKNVKLGFSASKNLK